jgi:predicted DNA-binding ribbon-helix-helix protein
MTSTPNPNSCDVLVSPQKREEVAVHGRPTVLRMESGVWDAVRDISRREGVSVNEPRGVMEDRSTESRRGQGPRATIREDHKPVWDNRGAVTADGSENVTLGAAIRVYVIGYFRRLADGETPVPRQ